MKVKAKKWLTKRAVCFACALDVYDFNLTISRHADSSWCECKDDGSFEIKIDEKLDKYWATVHLAHEMVHLKQFKRDELVERDGYILWKGERRFPSEYMSDEYFLEPHEMEARALEAWLMHKWSTRKDVLH